MTANTTAHAVRSLCTPEQHAQTHKVKPVILAGTTDNSHAALLAALDGILKFSSFLTPAQCALLGENAEATLHYIARALEKTGGAA